ncbi:MAG: exodeoxyribonuclease VII small subunit [Anaerosomatales bacterium]|nr:exodeoxyribonuclease VII small subunit [Anaerosomatales bacterium]MDT8433217.1 exodeoxyribonuclease VII small subunit [Anaerosomatales bacterium]
MADERYNFAQARTRLEEIVNQVRKKDTSLEKSLDLLEEGVRLANTCTELSDHTEWRTVAEEQAVADGETAGVTVDAGDEAEAVPVPAEETREAEADESPLPDDEAAPGE